MKTAAAYIRVSDERQDEFSPDSQLSLIKKYCLENDYALPAEYIFYDDGISAKSSARRAEFLKMIDLATSSRHPIDAIVVWKYSRFARNQEDSIIYKSMLKRCRVEVLSVSEPISGDPFGSLVERIIEWMDEYYLVRLSAEVRRGMREKALRGLPNAPPPIGYRIDGGQLIPDKDESNTVKMIVALYLSGLSIPDVAQKLNLDGKVTRKGSRFTPRSVYYILKNPIYAGYTRWSPEGRNASERRFDPDGFIISKGAHTPLIRKDVYLATNSLISRIGKREGNTRGKEYMLRGLLRCGKCGSAMVLCGGNIFRCADYECCHAPTVSAERVNIAVLSAIRALFPTFVIKPPIFKDFISTQTQFEDVLEQICATKAEDKMLLSDFFYSEAPEKAKNTVLSAICEKIVFFGDIGEIIFYFHAEQDE